MPEKRCQWCMNSDIEREYHDKEWGVPLHDDAKLFEFIILDGFQAGLSWKTILQKRNNFREAFDNFDAQTIAQYGQNKINKLMSNRGIIRNKLKINAAISNAQKYLDIQNEFGSFNRYIWQFTEGKTIINSYEKLSDIPSISPEAQKMSKELKKRDFKFTGPTICYAFMQAAGMVNDHEITCFRYNEINQLSL